MRLSLWPQLRQPWSDVLDVARHADATGWDGIYLADHFIGQPGVAGGEEEPLLEITAVLAALATATSRARLGTLVLGMTYRHPAVVANWAASLDHVSGGRLLLGVGTGWQQNEHDAYGIRLGPPGERIERFEEGVQAILGLLRSPRTTLQGRHYTLVDAVCEPQPLQDPLPLLIGARGDRMLRLVARYADEWNHWSAPDTFAARAAALDAACEAQGRDPATIARSTQAVVVVGERADDVEVEAAAHRAQGRPVVAGKPEQIAAAVAAWRDAGVDEVIVPDTALGRGARRADRLDALAEAIAPLR